MSRITNNNRRSKNELGIDLRALKREMRMIPFDIKKEMRLLDLLFNEKGISRTQVERDLLLELIEKARDMINVHQNKLERFQKCYDQIRSGKYSGIELLTPEELHIIQKESSSASIKKKEYAAKEPLRTGTHG